MMNNITIIIPNKNEINDINFNILKFVKPYLLYIFNSFFSEILMKKNIVDIKKINGKIL